MSVFAERVRDSAGDNVIVCRERDGKPECFWFKYGDAVHLAMVLGAMNIFNCDVVREIAQKAGVDAEDFVAKYCDSKPHPELYGMRGEVVRSE
jgi:2-hydroxychromene-2-carboxylate isomerase